MFLLQLSGGGGINQGLSRKESVGHSRMTIYRIIHEDRIKVPNKP